MNVLISTTTNHNPGDQFIFFGVKNILKHIFPEPPNYIYYDRNPNNMIDWPHDQNMKKGLQGTFMNNPIDWGRVDLVVLAGSPEFLHHPLAPIYEGLVDHPEIPLWVIGVGYTEPEFVLPLTDAEVKVLKRESTLIITRQRELSNRLELLLDKKITELPCPALFCFENFPEKTIENNTERQVAHTIEDYKEGDYFSSDPNDILEFIGKHKVYSCTRLHGVIAAISSGAYAFLYNDDFRCREAIKLFKEVIEADTATITAFKTRIFNQYFQLINSYHAKSFTT